MPGNAFTIELPYNQLLLLVMGLFMFVGATRGWVREFITSLALAALTAVLVEPSLAAKVVDYISRLFRLVVAFITGGGSVDPTKLLERYRSVEVPFSGENPYLFLVLALIVFVFLSYTSRSGDKPLNALNRILGGLLGLCNGYLCVWLVTQYLLRYFGIRNAGVAAAARPTQVAVAVQGLPSTTLFPSDGQQSILLLFFLITVFVLLGRLTTKPAKK